MEALIVLILTIIQLFDPPKEKPDYGPWRLLNRDRE